MLHQTRRLSYSRGPQVAFGLGSSFHGDFVGARRRMNASDWTIDNLNIHRDRQGRQQDPWARADGNNFATQKFKSKYDLPSDFRTRHFNLSLKGRYHSYVQKEPYSQIPISGRTTLMSPYHWQQTGTVHERVKCPRQPFTREVSLEHHEWRVYGRLGFHCAR